MLFYKRTCEKLKKFVTTIDTHGPHLAEDWYLETARNWFRLYRRQIL
jgi:hypothetical protein